MEGGSERYLAGLITGFSWSNFARRRALCKRLLLKQCSNTQRARYFYEIFISN